MLLCTLHWMTYLELRLPASKTRELHVYFRLKLLLRLCELLVVVGDDAELDKEDASGVDGASEGVARFEVSEVLSKEDLRGSVTARVIQAEL